MTDKYIVSKSEIEAAFKTVSQCKTADYCEGFNDALKAILDNAQVVNSEPVAKVIHIKDTGFLEDKTITKLMLDTKYLDLPSGAELYANPPASVPLEKYNKLLDALRDQVGAKDRAGWLVEIDDMLYSILDDETYAKVSREINKAKAEGLQAIAEVVGKV